MFLWREWINDRNDRAEAHSGSSRGRAVNAARAHGQSQLTSSAMLFHLLKNSSEIPPQWYRMHWNFKSRCSSMTNREICGRGQQWRTQPSPMALSSPVKVTNWKSQPGSSQLLLWVLHCSSLVQRGDSWHFEPPKWLFEANIASEEQNSSLTAKLGTGFMEVTWQNNRITSAVRGPSLWFQGVGEKPI